jgi:hypothetical protein
MHRERGDAPTPGQVIGEILDLTSGLTVMLLPLVTIALPGVILLLLLPAALLLLAGAIPIVLVGALLAPPYLVVRWLNARRSSTRRSAGA